MVPVSFWHFSGLAMIIIIIIICTAENEADANVSEMESSIVRSRDRLQSANRLRCGNVSSNGDASSEDSDNPNRFTDGELTDIARTGIEGTPPCRHRGDCDMSLICQYCNKAYCATLSQSKFFTRHKKMCRLQGASESEPGMKCSRY